MLSPAIAELPLIGEIDNYCYHLCGSRRVRARSAAINCEISPGSDLRAHGCLRVARNGTCDGHAETKLPDVRCGRERAANRKRACRDSSIERWSATASLNAGLGETMEYLRVQLKVCEGCGNLWFRTQNADVYGSCCAGKLAQHAKAMPEGAARKAARQAQRAALRGGAA